MKSSGARSGPLSSAAKQRAFTLVELVTVMMLVGILAVVAMPLFADKDAFAAAGFGNELTAALKHGRKSAVAMRRNVCVTLAGNTLTFIRNRSVVDGFACDVNSPALPLPGKSVSVLEAPAGANIAFDPASVTAIAFNGLGQPSAGVTLGVTGRDGSSSRVKVEADSGYVHALP